MQFVPGQTVGIDLGTTFSALAHLDAAGDPIPIPNAEGDVETPSRLVLAEEGRILVGLSREAAARYKPEQVLERIKREMGVGDFKRSFGGQELTPEFLSALILKKLKQDASKQLGPIGNAVITVPYYFNDARRKATQDAGKIAGLNVIDIINEPTAATLTYAWNQGELGQTVAAGQPPKTALVYDLGGGTFDVTLVRYTPTHFEVLATDGDVHLGGVDWTDRLVNFVAENYQGEMGTDPRQNPVALLKLRNECERAKLALSEKDRVLIPCDVDGKSNLVQVSRTQFEELTADLMQRTLDTLDFVLEMGQMKARDVHAIVLVGGSTLMPRVPKVLRELTGVAPFRGLSPHTAVAQGAAIHAAILEAKHRGPDSPLSQALRARLARVQQSDVNSHSLGLVIVDPRTGKYVNHLMIAKNTKIPTEVRKVFNTTEPHQKRVTIKVVEGDAPDPEACVPIGSCTIDGLPSKLPKGAPIEVCYAYTAAGRVEVSARDQASGKAAHISIERKGVLTESRVDAFARLAQEYQVD